MRNFIKFYQLIIFIYYHVDEFRNQKSRKSFKNNTNILAQEIVKLFIKQKPSLKKFVFHSYNFTLNLNFTSYPEAKYCFKNLTELECKSDINSEFFII